MAYKLLYLLVILTLGTLSCGPDLADFDGTLELKKSKLGQLSADAFVAKLNQFNSLFERENKKLRVWVDDCKSVLGLPTKEEEDPHYFEEVSKPLIHAGENLSNIAKYVGGGARVFGYLGVPGMTLIADLASYSSSLKNGVNVLKFVQPSHLKKQGANVYEFTSNLRKKYLGLNQDEKNDVLAKLREISVRLGKSQQVLQGIIAVKNELLLLLKASEQKPEYLALANSLVKNRFYLELETNMEVIFQMSNTLLTTGEILKNSLTHYEKETNIGEGLENFQKAIINIEKISASRAEMLREFKSPK